MLINRFNQDCGAGEYRSLRAVGDGSQLDGNPLSEQEPSHGEEIRKAHLAHQGYVLKCQHSKKVFADEEIAQFTLKRRNETNKIRFSI